METRPLTITTAIERECPSCRRWSQLEIEATLNLLPNPILDAEQHKITFTYNLQRVDLHCPRCNWRGEEFECGDISLD